MTKYGTANESQWRGCRVLLVHPELSLTGAPKVILDGFERMGSGISVRSVSARGGPLEERCRMLGPLKLLSDLPPGGTFCRRVIRRTVRARLDSWVRKWRPDIIYVNTASALHLAGALKLPRVPVLLHVHEMGTSLAQHTYSTRDLLKHWPTKYIAVSEAVRQDLIAEYGIHRDAIVVIHGFVSDDLDMLPSAASKTNTEKPLVIGGASGGGRWAKGNGLWLLMARELKNIIGAGRVRFVLVGVTENERCQELRKQAEKLELSGDVTFVAYTNDPYTYFADFDIFALTSWEDSCPLVVLENMMLGKPVVCFKGSGGAPEEVGEAGIVMADFSARAMAEAIAKLAADPGRMMAMGEAAHERVQSNFVASVQVPKIRAEILALLDREMGRR